MPRPSLYALEEALELPRSPYAGSLRSAPSGGFETYIRHSTKVEGGSSNEVYPALLGNRLKTFTGTLTGTGYRRNTPHPIASRSKNRTTNQKVVGSSPAERTPNPPANG